jgi:hypothetical protein
LTPSRLRTALDAGPHLVALSGHGSPGGCCGLDATMAAALTNGYHSFIAFADSCLTAQFEVEDATSEKLLQNGGGGAVAYVGLTQFGWEGVDEHFQRAFFHRLVSTRHLGLLADSRCALVNEVTGGDFRLYNKWVIFALNLLGDPEMPIWTRCRTHARCECG